MNVNIIYYTKTDNTKKVLDAIASVLSLKHKVNFIQVEQATEKEVTGADMIGFGSGIYAGNFGKPMIEFIGKLKGIKDKNTFIVSTSSSGKTNAHKRFKKLVTEKGFKLVNEFACKGYNNWGPFKLVGGIAKGHPNEEDLNKAKDFAKFIF